MIGDDNGDITTSVAFRGDGYEVEIVRKFHPRQFDRTYHVLIRDPNGVEIELPGTLWAEAKEYKV